MSDAPSGEVPATEPRPISRVTAVLAVRAGADAQRAGGTEVTCPYPATGPLEDRYRRYFWLRGWSLAADAPAERHLR